MYLGLWDVETVHCTATLSPESLCVSYWLRLVRYLNIFLPVRPLWLPGPFFSIFQCPNPNLSAQNNVLSNYLPLI